MIALIAESKTMLAVEREISDRDLLCSAPIYDSIADQIMSSLKGLDIGELAQETGLSSSLAAKMQKYIYDFGFKATGNRAIEAYTGVVFKALDYDSLTDETKNRCNKDVGIISSLYGWLRPGDAVKTYRLDFTTRLEVGPSEGMALNQFWRKDVTKALVKKIQDEGQREILMLLPGDAAKCVDWKLVKRFAKVWKVDFRELQPDDTYKTPQAGKLKTLRGMLLRQILTEGISCVNDMMHIESPHYFCEGTPQYPDHLSFLC